MSVLLNKQQHLVSRPSAEPMLDNFRLVEVPVPELAPGQVLVRHQYLSLDPYMVGRMREAKSYAAPLPLDQVMIGGTAGEVVASRNERFKVGDHVLSTGGWQQYEVVDASKPGVLRKVDTTHVSLSAYLGSAGMPGVTD
jgi:NADPH-dependent curcumin reductase CurA